MSVPAKYVDEAVIERVMQVIEPAQIEIAIKAVEELERQNDSVSKQWQMRLERAIYESELAQRRYEEVDPSNRLVASTLEKKWNDKLIKLEEVKKQHQDYVENMKLSITKEQKDKLFSIAKDFPRVWKAQSTKSKDKKQFLRLLIKDITIEECRETNQAMLHIRWQGGACEDLTVEVPFRGQRYSWALIEKVRELSKGHTNYEIAEILNHEGFRSPNNKGFNHFNIHYIRGKYKIGTSQLRHHNELTLKQV
jgi:hypothetical protein